MSFEWVSLREYAASEALEVSTINKQTSRQSREIIALVRWRLREWEEWFLPTTLTVTHPLTDIYSARQAETAKSNKRQSLSYP